jgi:uncharacterized membrane protein
MSGMSRFVVAGQGVYYVLTGIWPLVSLSTFEAVTGPKTDHWLVQTVGVLAAVIGLGLLAGARRLVPSMETVVLAVAAAVAFAAVDTVFVLREIIGPIYLADAAVEIALLAALFVTWRWQQRAG